MRKGIAWSTVAFVGGRGATAVSFVVLARVLDKNAIGVVAVVLIYLSLLDLLSDLGMGATVVYEQEQGITPRVQTAFTLNIVIAVSLCAVGIIAAPVFARFFGIESHADLFRLASLNLLFSGFGNIHDSLLLRNMEMRRRTSPQVIRAVIRGVVSVVLALSGVGAPSMVIGFLAGTLAWVIVLWLLVPLRLRPVFNREIARSMIGYGGAAAALEVIAVITGRVDSIVVGRALGVVALGLYTVGSRLPEYALDSVTWNLSLVAFPALARQRAANTDDIRRPTLAFIRYGSLYAVPLGVTFAVLATPLIVVIFTRKYAGGAGVLAAASMLYAAHALVYTLGDVFKTMGRQRTMITVSLVSMPILVLALALAAPYGLLTLAWVYTGVGYVQGFCLARLAARAAQITMRDLLVAARPALTAAIGAAAAGETVRLLFPSLTLAGLVLGLAAAGGGALLALCVADRSGAREIFSVARGGPLP